MTTVGIVGARLSPEVQRVRAALTRRDAEVLVADPSGFPGVTSARIGLDALRIGRVDLTAAPVWLLRQPELQLRLHHEMSASERDAIRGRERLAGALTDDREVLSWLECLAYSLQDVARVVNPPEASALHRRKPLLVARLLAAGLSVPESLTTTDRDEAASFVDSLDGRAVCKTAGGGGEALDGSEALRRLAPGSPLGPPMLFQRRIVGPSLRAYVVGGRVVSCARVIHGDVVDWRTDQRGLEPWPVDDDLAALLRAACEAAALNYAGIDVEVDEPTGRPYFLDINPAPLFASYERVTGDDVAGPLADLLLELHDDDPSVGEPDSAKSTRVARRRRPPLVGPDSWSDLRRISARAPALPTSRKVSQITSPLPRGEVGRRPGEGRSDRDPRRAMPLTSAWPPHPVLLPSGEGTPAVGLSCFPCRRGNVTRSRLIGLVGPRFDDEVLALSRALRRRGASARVLDLTGLPGAHRLSIRGDAAHFDGWELEALDAIYVRRLRHTPDEAALLAASEKTEGWDEALEGWFAVLRLERELSAAVWTALSLVEAPVINPLATQRVHPRKLHHLRTLAAAGLPVPPFLATNDEAALRDFVARQPEGAVVKPLRGFFKTELHDPEAALPLTSRPILVQRHLPGVTVRVYAVGGRVVAAAAMGNAGHVDSSVDPAPPKLVELTEAERGLVARAARAASLPFTGMDLQRHRDGEGVWVLECNAAPMFANFCRRTGADVAGPLAELLLEVAGGGSPWEDER